MYLIILVNVIETIVDWSISGTSIDLSQAGTLFLYMNFCFMLAYSTEASIRVSSSCISI